MIVVIEFETIEEMKETYDYIRKHWVYKYKPVKWVSGFRQPFMPEHIRSLEIEYREET